MPQIFEIFESLDFSKAMLFGARTWESQLELPKAPLGEARCELHPNADINRVCPVAQHKQPANHSGREK